MGGDLNCISRLGHGSVFSFLGKSLISNVDEIRLELNIGRKEIAKPATPQLLDDPTQVKYIAENQIFKRNKSDFELENDSNASHSQENGD